MLFKNCVKATKGVIIPLIILSIGINKGSLKLFWLALDLKIGSTDAVKGVPCGDSLYAAESPVRTILQKALRLFILGLNLYFNTFIKFVN